jgi:excisionase family DNA binding protein
MEGRQEWLEPLDRADEPSSLSGEVEAVGRGNRSMQLQCPDVGLPHPPGSRDERAPLPAPARGRRPAAHQRDPDPLPGQPGQTTAPALPRGRQDHAAVPPSRRRRLPRRAPPGRADRRHTSPTKPVPVPDPATQPLLSAQQVADILGTSTSKLAELVRAGQLDAIRVGRHPMFPAALLAHRLGLATGPPGQSRLGSLPPTAWGLPRPHRRACRDPPHRRAGRGRAARHPHHPSRTDLGWPGRTSWLVTAAGAGWCWRS